MALILIIDDVISVAEVVEAILTDAGHEVVTASNGRQGLERAKEKRPANSVSNIAADRSPALQP